MASLMALIFFGYIGGLWPRVEGTREFVSIGLGLTVLLVIFLVATRRKWLEWLASQESDSQKDSSSTQNSGTAGH